MNDRAIKALYDQLKPRERVLLTLEAMAREDHVETDRLKRSTPQKKYMMIDWEVTELWEATFSRAVAFLLLWHQPFWQYTFAVARVASDTDRDIGLDHLADAVIELKAIYAAFTRFCRGVGLSPDVFFRAWLRPIIPELEIVAEKLAAIPDDLSAEKEQEFYEVFCRDWPSKIDETEANTGPLTV